MTPLAETPSTQTITVSQAADATYAAGSATFTVSVADSTPFNGEIFTAGTDTGSSSSNGSPDEMTKGVVHVYGSDAAFATAEYRMYKSSTTTISTTDGSLITKIEFTNASSYPATGFGSQTGWTTSSTGGVWEGEAESVSFEASGAQVRATTIKVWVTQNTNPAISADNVNIAYDATNGSIAYTVFNPVTGGVVTASTTASWLTPGTAANNAVPFTCSANSESTARSATVTLTYTYDTNKTVTKDVTVTQAAAPVVYSTIPALFNAATSTSTGVNVTFDNWVVSGVSTNGKNVFVTDNAGNGFVIFDNNGGLNNTYSAGDILSGTAVSCNLVLYNGFAEITGLDASDLTITSGGTVTAANVSLANLAGINTGALVSYEGLTCSINNSKYYLSDGTTTLQVYNALYAFGPLESGKSYNITGVYQQYNTTKEICPRSADDIEEVVVTVPTIALSSYSVAATAAETEGSLTVTYTDIETSAGVEIHWFESNGTTAASEPDWIDAEINATTKNVDYLIAANTGADRTAYFKVYGIDANTNDVYSNLVTVSQAAYVVDFATLPFEWAGGAKDDLLALNGVTESGLGSDYAASNAPYRIKFDGAGDYIQIKTDSRPGVVSFEVKMLGGATTSKFKVQESSDDASYTDVQEFTVSGSSNAVLSFETTTAFASSSRYVRIIKSEHGSNVGVGPIAISKYVDPATIPSLTLSSYTIDGQVTASDGSLVITYQNLAVANASDFDIQFYDANNDETTDPDWFLAVVEANTSGYQVSYTMSANTGEARAAYFKVYAMDNDSNIIYSDLVTVTQPEAPGISEDYNKVSSDLVEGDYIIYFDGKAMNNTISGNRLQYVEVTPAYDVINTGDASIVWHIAPCGEYWTIYNAAVGKYAAGNNSNNQATLVDDVTDYAKWTVTRTGDTFEFENYGRSDSDNKYLRNNGTYGFACYKSSTGGALTLYKFESDPTPATVTATRANGRYWATFYSGTGRYKLPEEAQAFTMNSEHKLYLLGDKGDIIPLGTAVIIIADAAGTASSITLELENVPSTGAVTVYGGDNYLKGSDAAVPTSGIESGKKPYVLGIPSGGALGFYEFTGSDIPANKAYYVE